MPTLSAPSYRHEPIASLSSLARALGISLEELNAAHAHAPTSYRPRERRKPDGGIRITYSVHPLLKAVQKSILHRLLRNIELPDYLLGGRPGKDYLANVQFHCGARILFGEDVTNFYPSIRRAHVRSIFQELMLFTADVSDYLADLCVFEDAVPQGASTSGDLANLVLWRREPGLVADFSSRGLKYSRFVDDIYVSADRSVTADEKTWIVGQLHRLLQLEGFRVKRKKHELASARNRMHVHRVGINAGRPTLSRPERRRIRAAVHQFEATAKEGEFDDTLRRATKVRGRIARLKRLHPKEYARLSAHLDVAVRNALAAQVADA